MRAAVVYEGPSQLDGAPIVVIASMRTANPKTGPVVQTWILRADMSPTEAARLRLDSSVCGECRHRHALGGGCYVNLGQAPWNIWQAYDRGQYPRANVAFLRLLAGRMLRIGAYGDPAAVPVGIWDGLVAATGRWIGYTHQWRTAPHLRELCMASCDSPAEYAEATAAGWRAFLVLADHETPPARAFECVNVTRGTTCEACGACDGARPGRDVQPASVWLRAHGTGAARFNHQRLGEALAARPAVIRRLRVLG